MSLQILVYREMMVNFHGNELTIGCMLSAWLIWGGLGSSITQRQKIKSFTNSIRLALMAISITYPLSLISFKLVRPIWGIATGEVAGIFAAFISSFLFLSLPCFLNGMLFSLLARICLDFPDDSRVSPIMIFVFESVGGFFSAIILRLVMAEIQTPLKIIVLSALGLIMCIPISFSFYRKLLIRVLILSGAAGTLLLNFTDGIELEFDHRLFKDFHLMSRMDSPYSRLHLIRNGSDNSLFVDSSLTIDSGDRQFSEMTAHLSLVMHRSPKKILLLENAFGSLAEEILRHPVEKLDVTLLDGDMLQTAKLSDDDCLYNGFDDARVTIYIQDPITYLSSMPSASYDVIILCSGDPTSISQARLKSLEFFNAVRRILTMNGVFTFSISGSENYMNPSQAEYISVTNNTLKKAFAGGEISIIPGDRTFFFAAQQTGQLLKNSVSILDEIKRRNIHSYYVSEAFLPFLMNDFNLQSFRKSITDDESLISTDFDPAVFRASLRTWTSQFSKISGYLFGWKKTPVYLIFGIWVLLNMIGCLNRKTVVGRSIELGAFSVGATQIIFSIIGAFLLQIRSGAAYLQTGLLIGSFNLGLMLGSASASHFISPRFISRFWAGLIQLLVSMLVVCIIAYMKFLGAPGEGLLNAAALSSGILGGVHFSILSRIIPSKTSLIYGIDLLGSAFGAITVTLFLLTNCDIISTLKLIAALPAVAAIGLFRSAQPSSGDA